MSTDPTIAIRELTRRIDTIERTPALPGGLSRREHEALTLFCNGGTAKMICRTMGVGQTSIGEFVRRMKRKTGTKSMFALGMWAQRNGYEQGGK